MARVVSGFKKQRRSRRTLLTYAVLAARKCKRLLSYPVATLPSRRKKQRESIRPQAYLQRDVLRKRLNNPYAKEPRVQRFIIDFFTARRFSIGLILLLSLISAWFSVLFVKPTFYIERVTVKGTEEINPDDVISLAQEHLSKRNWFLVAKSHRLFMDTEALTQAIRERYDLDQLEFAAHWPSKSLELTLKEKPSMLVYAANDKHYAVDKNGNVIRELGTNINPQALAIPVIYDYDPGQPPGVGSQVLTASFIESVRILADGLASYGDVHIHSFRIRVSPQREIRIADKIPESSVDQTKQASDANKQLAHAAESIASAKTIDEKVKELKQALQDLEVEKLEEGRLDQLLKEERVYSPTEGYAYQELEVYMQEGWSLKLGHMLFDNTEEANEVLNIFATLNGQLNMKEVREYIDLRFANRVYYR